MDNIVKLRVNLSKSTATALTTVCAENGYTLTGAIWRAIALLNMANTVRKNGQRLMIVTGQGHQAKYEEIIL